MENEIDIVSSVEEQGDEAAFTAGFNGANVGQEVVAVEEVTPAEDTAATDATVENAEVVAEITEVVEVVEAPKLFAGLTEEQLQAALARNGALQSTVDKMAGRMGQLMQQIEAIKATPPTTQVGQVALDLKLEKLGTAFPHLAELLREDLQQLQGSNATAAPLPDVPQGITQEQLDATFAERLADTQSKFNDQLERKVLGILHPNWLEDVSSPAFALYRDNVLAPGEGAKLMESEDSSFISNGLTAYKKWLEETTAAKVSPTTPAPSARLLNAVIPTKGGKERPSSTGMTEEDAFASGFAKERGKRGYAS
jgi:hypothetical protein